VNHLFINKENQIRHFWKIAFGIGIIIISVIITMLISDSFKLHHVSYNSFNLGLLFGTIIFLKFIYKARLAELGLTFNKQELINIFYGILTFFGVGLLSFSINDFTFRYVFPAFDNALLFLLVRYLTVAASEELLFRVFLIGYFRKKTNVTVLVLISSILFAAFHLLGQKDINWGYLFNIFIMGLFISLLYIISNSFYLVLFYHMLHNIFNFHTDKIFPMRICFCVAIIFLLITLFIKNTQQRKFCTQTQIK
jgi:membrane protease YdiL (CAAX protease family)